MKNFNVFMLVVLASFFLSSCTGNAVYLRDSKTYTVTDPKSIEIYSSVYPSVKFEVVGYVSTYTSDANHAGDQLKNNLRAQAAKYGANAIIGFKLNMAEEGGGAQGVAVRYLQ
ncbi:MAG: heavy metal-binding domain-containing protein [Ignavibacteriales bacterium]|nr:heavy metal-binding domain-containing protein [Ignavibacteriales bacterium]